MKKKLLLMTCMAVTASPLFICAQSDTIRFQQINTQPKEFRVPGNVFSLFIFGAPRADSIQVILKGNPENPVRGQSSGNMTVYNLNKFVNAIKPDEKKEFAIRNGKTLQEIHDFSLIGGSIQEDSLSSEAIAKLLNEANYIPIAFYDAQTIFRDYDKFLEGDSKLDFLLDKYNFIVPEGKTVRDVVLSNPFFFRFDTSQGKKISPGDRKVGAQSLVGGALANLAGIDVTKYVQGAADFLRDRIKEELALAFIDKFKATIESIPELRALLPKTYNVFKTSDIFKVASLGQTYKTAFQQDLENFIENFEMFVDTATKERYISLRNNQIFTAFRVAYHTIEMSANDFHPIDIFENLDERFGLDTSAGRIADINKYISLLNHLSQHLRKKQAEVPENGWISVDELKSFNPKAILLFWGLLYQQKPELFESIKINSKSLKDIILKASDILPSGTSAIQVYLKQFITVANNIDNRIREFNEIIKTIKGDAEALNVAIRDFIANADKLVEITDFIFSLPYFNDQSDNSYYLSEYYTKWRVIILDVIEITKGIYIKDYAKIAVNATSLINDLSRMHGDSIFTKNFLEHFTFYSNFIVDAINADSADDVKAVLNRYAQPVGSYRVKRKTPFSVSLNAYPGLYYGWETYKDSKEEKMSNRTFGVTAPIGFSFNFGDWPGENWSASVFLNAIDIAAALSYRWTNDTLDLPETITLGQIFAPGAFFVLGFPKVPVSTMIGAQYVPQLRSITENGNKTDEIPILRFSISVVVDIPIFNFYTRSK